METPMVTSACPRPMASAVMAPTIETIMLTVNSTHKSIKKQGARKIGRREERRGEERRGGREGRRGGVK